ncbi:hypothetical protein [Lysinibacillus sp. LZ02]|uniref:pyocin knob domain-containing protein n=1 Tax=Lysinibacillus sp. LZ02 TaxID=3420668 RepID=UPI003D35C316
MPTTHTSNYNLAKPGAEEFYDVSVPNANMDKIDAVLKALADALGDIDLVTLSQAIQNVQNEVTEHKDNNDIHIKKTERADWNAKISSIAKYMDGGSHIDPDTTTEPCILTTTKTPDGSFWYIITIFYGTSGNKAQLAIKYHGFGDIATRNLYNGTWSAWDRQSDYYKKPSTGIPKADLHVTVQALLDKAHTAVQSPGIGLGISGTTLNAEFALTYGTLLSSHAGVYSEGETVNPVNVNATHPTQLECNELLRTLLGYTMTSETSFRYVIRTVKYSTIITQTVHVYSNYTTTLGTEVFRFTRTTSFSYPYDWNPWRITTNVIVYEGNPNGSVYGMRGWLLYDFINAKLYKKTTGTSGSFNTGWVEIGGA